MTKLEERIKQLEKELKLAQLEAEYWRLRVIQAEEKRSSR